jgi:hypothetical protein
MGVPEFPGQQKLNRHDAKTPRWKLRLGRILPWRLGVMAVQSSSLPEELADPIALAFRFSAPAGAAKKGRFWDSMFGLLSDHTQREVSNERSPGIGRDAEGRVHPDVRWPAPALGY